MAGAVALAGVPVGMPPAPDVAFVNGRCRKPAVALRAARRPPIMTSEVVDPTCRTADALLIDGAVMLPAWSIWVCAPGLKPIMALAPVALMNMCWLPALPVVVIRTLPAPAWIDGVVVMPVPGDWLPNWPRLPSELTKLCPDVPPAV